MESKTFLYFKYAIGEIVLVVIGILIALQINNWNEERKELKVETNILKDIKRDIFENINNLESGITQLKASNNHMKQVIQLYENKIPYTDSLLPLFSDFNSYWDPDFTYAGFENLKSLGVSLISNEQLRKEIINLIEVEMDILDRSEMSRLDQISITMTFPMIRKYFHRDLSSVDDNLPLIPSDYEAMMNDIEFFNFCTELGFRQMRSIVRYQNFNSKASKLIDKIDNELKQLL